jgi:pantothenate kinase type III
VYVDVCVTVFGYCMSFRFKLALVIDASTATTISTAVVDYRMLQLHSRRTRTLWKAAG